MIEARNMDREIIVRIMHFLVNYWVSEDKSSQDLPPKVNALPLNTYTFLKLQFETFD